MEKKGGGKDLRVTYPRPEPLKKFGNKPDAALVAEYESIKAAILERLQNGEDLNEDED